MRDSPRTQQGFTLVFAQTSPVLHWPVGLTIDVPFEVDTLDAEPCGDERNLPNVVRLKKATGKRLFYNPLYLNPRDVGRLGTRLNHTNARAPMPSSRKISSRLLRTYFKA